MTPEVPAMKKKVVCKRWLLCNLSGAKVNEQIKIKMTKTKKHKWKYF